MASDWWVGSATTIVLTIVTSILTLLVTKGLETSIRKIKKGKEDREYDETYAFNFSLRFGNIWYIRKLAGPKAQDFMYRIVDPANNIRPGDDSIREIEPHTNYGIHGLNIRDTIEIYWTEDGEQYSTFQILHDEQTEYLLRRENIGH